MFEEGGTRASCKLRDVSALYSRGWPDCCYVIKQESTKRFSVTKTRRFVWTLDETPNKRLLVTSRQVQDGNFVG
jgi:hypothetical protein